MNPKRRGPTHPIPDAQSDVHNLADAVFLPCEGYQVAEWHRLPDGRGQPEAVLFNLLTKVGYILAVAERILVADLEVTAEAVIALRVKSREEMNRMIEILERHRDQVWPLQ